MDGPSLYDFTEATVYYYIGIVQVGSYMRSSRLTTVVIFTVYTVQSFKFLYLQHQRQAQ
jgi:hypothetical protein